MTPPLSSNASAERILESGMGLFLRYGAKAVTMDMLASELGISKKTIYQHFPDKDALVLEGCRFYIKNKECRMNDEVLNIEDPLEQFMAVSQHLRQEIQAMNPVLMFDMKRFYPDAWAEVERHKKEDVHNHILTNFEEGIKVGYYRDDFDQKVLMRLKIEEYTLALDSAIFPTTDFRTSEVFDALTDHFIRGILTPKGLERYLSLLETPADS